MLSALPAGLAVGSGGLIGLVLGVIGGGGSILAVPLLVYAVGMASPHMAIGTAAFAVAVNAAAGLALHARRSRLRWPCAIVFSIAGVAGAFVGAAAGKAVDGQKLLALFGVLMMLVGGLMLRPKAAGERASLWLSRESASRLLPRLTVLGAAVGLLSGFFGIGGGFLIVPGLMLAADMELKEATSASLIAVLAFGLASATSYAWSGLVDWPVALLLIAGGAAGAIAGTRLNSVLAQRRGLLTKVFAWFVILAGVYVSGRGFATLLG
ncbi:MAG: sulfite exporter TauE/SafE family protein [Proteobacteria bacterium]|nr:sulfite exporter TauE/SafE family protein [Pseudomonadota bacterium]